MPASMGLPVWSLGNGNFLIDDLETDILSVSSSQSSTLSMMTLSDPPTPGGGGTNGGGGVTNVFVYTFPKDGLWIELTNVANGYASGLLHHPTNLVYAILTSTNLSNSAWNVEQQIFPGTNTNAVPFSIATLNRSNLFLQAHDWTGITHGGNVTPDWWFWHYFETTNLTDNTLDSTGYTLLYDYQNGLDPNVISFSVSITNSHVRGVFPVQMNVSSGIPKYYTVAIDSTNSATWWNCSGQNLSLGFASDGWHTVYIGLRGSPSGTITWQAKRIRADLTPPTLGITSPSGTVQDTAIQLCGFSSKPLANIRLDISNSTGTKTNQLVVITGQAYDTNTIEYTTNYWQCYDLPLAIGENQITIRATDLAGNAVLLTTTITCVGHTDPPSITLRWPQNGMRINDTSITIKGQVDDPTASVAVEYVEAGVTNTYTGITGRDGIFWIENVPLSAAINVFTLRAINAAGQSSTNFTLTRSPVSLTVNTMQPGATTASGSIGASGYTIWVNGTKATVNGNGTWTADITPISIGGGQVQVSAIPDTDNGGNGSGGGSGGSGGAGVSGNPTSDQSVDTQITLQAPQGAYLSSFHENWVETGPDWTPSGWQDLTWTDTIDWEDGVGGRQHETWYDYGEFLVSDETCPASFWPQAVYPPMVELAQANYVGPGWSGTRTCTDVINSQLKLATGGPLGSKAQRLWCVTVYGLSYENEHDFQDAPGTPIPPQQISIGSFGKLGADGVIWLVLPDNDPDDISPSAPEPFSRFSHVSWPNDIAITANGTALSPTSVVNSAKFCVGQNVSFSLGNLPWGVTATNFQWTLGGTFVNQIIPPANPNSSCTYTNNPNLLKSAVLASNWWTSGDYQPVTYEASVTCTLVFANGNPKQTITTKGKFSMHRPEIYEYLLVQGSVSGAIYTNSEGVIILWTYPAPFLKAYIHSAFDGQAGITQVGSGFMTNIIGGKSSGGAVALDNSEFYLSPWTDANGLIPVYSGQAGAYNHNITVLGDSPGINCNGHTTIQLDFNDYIRFKPNGTDSVAVTLGTFKWNIHASADPSTNGFYRIVGTPNGSIDPNFVSSQEFPSWTMIFTNTTSNP